MVAPFGVVFVIEGIIFVASFPSLRCFAGKPRSRSPASAVGETSNVVLPLEG
jgi:hypothetical protein